MDETPVDDPAVISQPDLRHRVIGSASADATWPTSVTRLSQIPPARPTFGSMEPTAITVISQLITDARTRFGANEIEAVAVDAATLDEAMGYVLSAGGDVSMDTCTVDGVEVRELPHDADTPLAYVRGEAEPRALSD